MTGFLEKLAQRCLGAGINLSVEEAAALERYFDLLVRWNAKINLTALHLESFPPGTIDRLFVEPLAAARHVSVEPMVWLDIGSGGGSPAIPLKIMRPAARLTMVESRSRKAAFLREAVRVLRLAEATVVEERFEGLAAALPARADLITVRAVRIDTALIQLCRQALAPKGKLMLFQSSQGGSVQLAEGFSSQMVRLTDGESFLQILDLAS